MGTPSGTDKVCMICGADCAARPRVKDDKGRYYCKPCHEKAAERRHGEAEPLLGFGLPLEEVSPSPTAAPPAPARNCPSCGRALLPSAVLCTACGYSTESGHRVALPSTLELAVQKSAPWFLSPVYLFVRPATFFRNFVNSGPALTALFAWVFGMAGVIDQIDTRMAMAQMGGRSFAIPDEWAAHWAMIGGGGILAGLLYAGVGGWWYRVRLGWSGHKQAELRLVRRVYILASMVYAIPALLVKAIHTLMYDKPSAEAAASLDVLDGLVLLCVFWSVWNSFVGVRTVFQTQRVAAIVWFLALPMTLYGVVLIGTAAVTVAMAWTPPNITQPRYVSSPTLRFSYPGNWTIDTADPDYDPHSNLFIEPPFQDAGVQITIDDSDEELDVLLDAGVHLMRANARDVRTMGAFSNWGRYTGKGQTLAATNEGTRYTIRLFVANLEGGRVLHIHEVTADSDQASVEPGLELIRSTFSAR